MKHFSPFLIGLVASVVSAHTAFTTIYIDDVSQGDGTCVRMNMNAQNCTSPVPSLSSDDMACGSTGETAVAFTCPAAAGAKLSFEWRMWADLEQEGTLDPSHKGPCAVYAKQIDDMTSSPAAGPSWVKIWEEGFDDSTNKWCTEKLIDGGGIMSVRIPDNLPAGNYLFRPELLALHNADQGDPQFYTGCAQIQVQGTNKGTLDVPSEYSVSIPGYVKNGDASVSFNIYSPVFPYPMPGPSVYSFASTSSSGAKRKSADAETITGATLVPSNCLIKEANWCGVEVADYNTEDGCWKGSEDCYDQAQACYDSVPPTGDKNCRVWEAKCQGIQDACSAGTFNGPPNKGQQLQDAEVRSGVVVPSADNLGTGETTDAVASGSETATPATATAKSTASAVENYEEPSATTAISVSSTATCGQKVRRGRYWGSRK